MNEEPIVGDAKLLEALEAVAPYLTRLLGTKIAIHRVGSESSDTTDGSPSEDAIRIPITDPKGQEFAALLMGEPDVSLPPESGAMRQRLLHAESTDTTWDASLGTLRDALADLLKDVQQHLPDTPTGIVWADQGSTTLQYFVGQGLSEKAFKFPLASDDGPVATAIHGENAKIYTASEFGLDDTTFSNADSVMLIPIHISDGHEPSVYTGPPAGALLVVTAPQRTLSESDMALLNHVGAHAGLLIHNMGLTERLHRSSETTRKMLQRAHLGMALLDANGRVQHTNQLMRQFLGREIPENTMFSQMLLEGDRERFEVMLEDAGSDTAEPAEMTLLGEERQVPVHLSSTPIRDHSKHLDGHFVLARDLTRVLSIESERRALTKRVQQAEKLSAVGKFVAGIAHELNNPLTVVIGYTEHLTSMDDLPEEHQKSLAHILTHARRSGRIVDDLLKFSHRERSHPEAVLLAQVIQEAIAVTEQRHANVIDIVVQVSSDLPPVAGSPHALSQLLTNIVSNAIDAVSLVKGKGKISIRLTRTPGEQRIEIDDNGPGIPEVERIFDPFYTTKPIGHGTGLGLSICYGIVREHDGELFAENLKQGARFTVVLPEAAQEKENFPALPGVDQEKHHDFIASVEQPKILVVDDEAAILSLICDALKDVADIATAETVETALSMMDGENYTMVLTDLRLPAGLTGADFYELILERWPHMSERVSFMTGDTIGQATQAFLDRVRRPCLAKPFKLSKLHAFVMASIRQNADIE